MLFLPFRVMAAYDPTLWSNDVQPLVIWHVLPKTFTRVMTHLKWASQCEERFGQSPAEISVEV
jgi:hypothetical protein